MITPTAPLSREIGGGHTTAPSSFFLDILFIQRRVQDTPVSDYEPIILGEEPPSVTHADTGIGPITYGVTMKPVTRSSNPISKDEAYEVGETPHDKALWERYNSHRNDRRHA